MRDPKDAEDPMQPGTWVTPWTAWGVGGGGKNAPSARAKPAERPAQLPKVRTGPQFAGYSDTASQKCS